MLTLPRATEIDPSLSRVLRALDARTQALQGQQVTLQSAVLTFTSTPTPAYLLAADAAALYQSKAVNLSALAGLGFSAPGVVKMTGAGVFVVDTNYQRQTVTVTDDYTITQTQGVLSVYTRGMGKKALIAGPAGTVTPGFRVTLFSQTAYGLTFTPAGGANMVYGDESGTTFTFTKAGGKAELEWDGTEWQVLYVTGGGYEMA